MRSTRLAVSIAGLAVAGAGLTVPTAEAAPAPAPTAPYHVTLQASTKVAVAKQDKVVLSGTVTPKPPEGSKVVVQAKYDNGTVWRKLGTAVVKPNGKYRFIDKPNTHFDRAYRVSKKADATALADKSRQRSVKVLAWNWLNQMQTSAGEGLSAAASLPINGDTYTHVLYAPTLIETAFAEYTLGRNCTTFETTFGLSDRTETGGQATISLTDDGVVKYARTFNLGESDDQTIDVTNVYRMRLDFAQVTTTPDTEPAAGTARVLCD
jgi:hypothetical protein